MGNCFCFYTNMKEAPHNYLGLVVVAETTYKQKNTNISGGARCGEMRARGNIRNILADTTN